MTGLTWLPPATNERLARAAAALRGALGDRMRAAVVVGHAMNPVRFDRAQRPQLLCVTSGSDLDLAALARALAPSIRAGVFVRLVSARELDRSCDVFALEIAEWKARHHVLDGVEPFADLAPSDEHLRHAIEAELRGLLRRTRNLLVATLATGDGRAEARAVVHEGYDRAVVAAHHILRLRGEDPPGDEPSIVRRVASVAGADAGPFLEHLALLRRGEPKEDALAAHGALVALLAPMVELVDAHGDGASAGGARPG